MAIQDFTDLDVWQVGHSFRLKMYEMTNVFPKDEKFGLTSQLRRASSSFTANIAEGFGRQTSKDQEYFYIQAHGSLYECRDHLLLARDLTYADAKKFREMYELANRNRLHKIMNGFLRSHRNRRASAIESRTSFT